MQIRSGETCRGARATTACLSFFLALACSGGQPAPAPAAPESPAADAPPAAGATSAANDTDSVPGASAGAAPANADEAPPAPRESMVAVCNSMCDAVAPKCTKTQLEGCRSTCKNYEDQPLACDPVVKAAFDCARNERDFLFCSNVIPEVCGKKFKAVGYCLATGEPPVEAVKKAMPDGWERFEARDSGFSVVMPKGAESKTENGVRVVRVTAPSGATYEVTTEPAPPEKKWDNRAFLRLSRKLFGRCADKMKLHAIVEKPDQTSIQFRTSCPENTEQLGRMHVVGNQLYVLKLTHPPGAQVEVDAFVYSFEPRK